MGIKHEEPTPESRAFVIENNKKTKTKGDRWEAEEDRRYAIWG